METTHDHDHDYTPASELDDATRARARRGVASEKYTLTVEMRHKQFMGRTTPAPFWCFQFWSDGKPVWDASIDIAARDYDNNAITWRGALVFAYEHYMARVGEHYELNVEDTHESHHEHMLRQLCAIREYARERVGLELNETVVLLD